MTSREGSPKDVEESALGIGICPKQSLWGWKESRVWQRTSSRGGWGDPESAGLWRRHSGTWTLSQGQWETMARFTFTYLKDNPGSRAESWLESDKDGTGTPVWKGSYKILLWDGGQLKMMHRRKAGVSFHLWVVTEVDCSCVFQWGTPAELLAVPCHSLITTKTWLLNLHYVLERPVYFVWRRDSPC